MITQANPLRLPAAARVAERSLRSSENGAQRLATPAKRARLTAEKPLRKDRKVVPLTLQKSPR
jgi:hypothetical protein